jgi:hypothetical protein
MIRRALLPALMLALIASGALAEEAKLSVGKDDTVRSVLAAQVGKRVTLSLDSGQELTGTVRSVGDHVVHLGELAGKEYFDAVVSIDKISAVVIRVK